MAKPTLESLLAEWDEVGQALASAADYRRYQVAQLPDLAARFSQPTGPAVFEEGRQAAIRRACSPIFSPAYRLKPAPRASEH